MSKDREFQEIMSEDSVDFQMSAATLQRNQKKSNLEIVAPEGQRGVQGNKNLILNDNKEGIRKRTSTIKDKLPNMAETKPITYRQKSRNRYTGLGLNTGLPDASHPQSLQKLKTESSNSDSPLKIINRTSEVAKDQNSMEVVI